MWLKIAKKVIEEVTYEYKDGDIKEAIKILKEVAKYYNDAEDSYELDDLDNQIWDTIGKFVKVCEQFYLEGEEKND